MKTKTLEYRITNTEVSIRQNETGWLTFWIGGPVAGMFLMDIFDEYNRLQRVEAAARDVVKNSHLSVSINGKTMMERLADALEA